ncbi:MAG: hypothetical protein JXQ83_06995 [Candidatus Glassbacteria bacterium]|nr:hypothetical protein [Candidatus Glassbacteria bacterium]
MLSIMQDRDGYMWFGTWNGANRFDGKVMTSYYASDGLAGNQVRTMLADRAGNLWFGTDKGLSRLSGGEWTTFTTGDGLASNYVWSLLEDRDGSLWVGTQGGGLSRYDGSGWTTFTAEHGLAGNRIKSLCLDSRGSLWCGTDWSGAGRYDGKTWETFNTRNGLAHNHVNCIIQDSRGCLWFGTSLGATRYDGETWKTYATGDVPAGNVVNSILEDEEGNLWFSTNRGVARFDGRTWTVYTTENGLAHEVVFTSFEDREGNLWFGTNVRGVSILRNLAFSTFTQDQGLADNIVYPVLEDRRGDLWFGTYGGGASRFDRKTWKRFTTADGLAQNFAMSLLEDRHGNIWFGTYNGVSMFDGSQWKTFRTAEGLAHDYVVSLLEDRHGNLWFGTQGAGVCRYDGVEWETFNTGDGLAGNNVFAMLEDRHGNLWFGTEGGGVGKYDQKQWSTFTTEDGLAGNEVNAIFEDSQGNLWFGTESGGVSKFDGSRFSNYSTVNGLASNTCYFIIQDENYLYFGTNKGISRFDGSKFKLYTSHDGLATNEMNRGGCTRDSKGNLWFGTIHGATRYDPKLDRPDLVPPPIHITRVSTIDNKMVAHGSRLGSSENHLRFEYAGISFGAPEALVYSYKLEGSDADWQVSTSRTVQYTHLPGGRYVFKVKAMNRDGVWSESPAQFAFTIAPAVWKTWWFRTVSLVLVAGIIIMAFKYWLKRRTARELKEKNIELENTLKLLNLEILEHKKTVETLREREMFNFALFEHNPVETIVVDLEGRIASFNLAKRNSGDRVPGIGEVMYRDYAGKHEVDMFSEMIECIESGELREFPERKYGDKILSIKIAPFRSGAIITSQDITESKRAKERIQDSLREKELLLQEIYHRVKNNLQVISSLLNLKSKAIVAEKDAQVFEDCKNFIRAMTLIHERLYQSKDLAKIDFKGYVIDIVEELVEAYNSENRDKVILKLDLEQVSLGIDSAIPCGLVLNELVTNALKHAFPRGKPGEIEVSLHYGDGKEIELAVCDNGVGIPEGLDFARNQSLGLMLVTGLVKNQLQGKIEFIGNEGTEVRISFRETKP